MFFNKQQERPVFGKKETLSPEQALKKLHETNEEVAQILDVFLQREDEIHTQAEIIGDGYTREDEYLRTKNKEETLKGLSELGMEVSEETLYKFLIEN